MHRYYCSAPGCRGHHSRWQRCDLQRAFCGAGACGRCSPFGGCAEASVDGQGMVSRGLLIPGGEEALAELEWV